MRAWHVPMPPERDTAAMVPNPYRSCAPAFARASGSGEMLDAYSPRRITCVVYRRAETATRPSPTSVLPPAPLPSCISASAEMMAIPAVAEAHAAMGFCVLNTCAIAAQVAREQMGCQRVLIVDWDIHHGNGIQHIFEDDPSVLYFSVHRYERGQFFPESTIDIGSDGAAASNSAQSPRKSPESPASPKMRSAALASARARAAAS